MNVELIMALEQLEKEKGIEKNILIEAIEAALTSAYRKNFGSIENVRISIDPETGGMRVYTLKKVMTEPENEEEEISLEAARKINMEYEEGDIAEIETTPGRFGRIAAQTAKQVVMQKIREAEREIIYEEYYSKEGDIVTGIIQRNERRNIIIDLGKAEAIMTPPEQASREEYRFNDRIKTYIVEVKRTTKGPQILVSRTHPGLVKRLFELEVPEIHDGIVEIKSISREAGSRTKIAVFSRDPNVDPVGACVGQKGTRVQAIVDELRGEKIDIIKWSSDPEEYISSSISPAKAVRVDTDEEEKTARVIVPDFQLSLAIGKEGQNARLAAKLTGWRIDIKSESQLRAVIEQQMFVMDNDYNDDEYEEDNGDITDEPEYGDIFENEYGEDADARGEEEADEVEQRYDEEYDEVYYEEYDKEYEVEGEDAEDGVESVNAEDAGETEDVVGTGGLDVSDDTGDANDGEAEDDAGGLEDGLEVENADGDRYQD